MEVTTEKKIEKKVETKVESKQTTEVSTNKKLFKATVIERPNYDFLPEKKEEKEKVVLTYEKSKPNKKIRFKFAFCMLSVLIMLFGGFAISSTIDLVNSSGAYSEAYSEYSMNLAKYLAKIHALDNTNKANEAVIPTYPEELDKVTDATVSTNWFDKLCNFLSKLFGG